MKREKAIAIIRKEFAHVDVKRVVIEYDRSAECEIAKVFVPSDQVGAAFGKDLIHGRRAAMRSGFDILIEAMDPKPKPTKRRADRKHQKKPAGRFILHRFCGEEEFVIKTAEMRAIREGKTISLWFEAETDGVRLKSVPDTAEHPASPWAEACVRLKALDATQLVGQKFKVTAAYDEKEQSSNATLYYFEHQDLWRNVIEIVGQDGGVFEVRWSGVTTDVNYYDGSKPDTKVKIEGRFRFVDLQEWVGARKEGKTRR